MDVVACICDCVCGFAGAMVSISWLEALGLILPQSLSLRKIILAAAAAAEPQFKKDHTSGLGSRRASTLMPSLKMA